MGEKRQEANNEAEWRNAKKLCRLSRRQVAMARALAMNPKKLPSLCPSTQQRWKLPVGAFIEECYRKRFGVTPQTKPITVKTSKIGSVVDVPPGEQRIEIGPERKIANAYSHFVMRHGHFRPVIEAKISQMSMSVYAANVVG